MKKIVVYQSGTGFTQKYANWIAEELGCEAKEYKKIKPEEVASFDMVIYGGWIFAGMVFGYDKIKPLNLENLLVFGVGMSVPSEELLSKIAEQNGISKDCLFYFEGGYNPGKLGFFKKLIMNMIKKTIEKKEEKTPEDIHMLESFNGVDNTNKEAIKPLLEVVSKF